MAESPDLDPANSTEPFAEPAQHVTKLFLGRCSGKLIPIGAEYHQAEVPIQLGLDDLRRNRESIVNSISNFRKFSKYRVSRTEGLDLDAFFLFAEQYLEDKDPDVFQQALYSKEQMRCRAADLLHKADYNISKAKFMLVFPYYMAYNMFRSDRPLRLTDAEMEDKIKQHTDSLKDSRSRDLQRWMGQIQESIESRITLNKLNALIDQARQNKFEVPETIRDQIDRATKCGKELKKLTQNKQPLDKLKAKKDSLADQKIITNDMINFEEAIVRCEDWIVRANAFEDELFEELDPMQVGETVERRLRSRDEKIDFKQMHILVQEYNSLPILHQGFEANTRKLHTATLALVERLPQFTKVAKTRTSNQSKVSLGSIKRLLAEIDRHEVLHEDFIFFRQQISEAMELLERISMFLEDQKSEKTTKLMTGYLKLVNDIPIQTDLPTRLQNMMEYYTLIERIKKDIINPNRFEQTQDLISQALTKGFCSSQLIEYESKLKVYKGWFKSAKILNVTEKERRLVDLIKDEGAIIRNMVDETAFRAQLYHARTQLNIDAQDLQQYEKRFEQIEARKQIIRTLLSKDEPDLVEMVSTLIICIKDSIKYPEFISLYMRVNHFVIVLVKVVALLSIYNHPGDESINGHSGFNLDNLRTFLKKSEYEELLTVVSNTREIKEITKEDAECMYRDSFARPFPRNLPEWILFGNFLTRSNNWQAQATSFLTEYESSGELDDLTLDRLLVSSQTVITDTALLDHLTQVHKITRWKGVLQQRLGQPPSIPLTQSLLVDLSTISLHLNNISESNGQVDYKKCALDFGYTHRQRIRSLLEFISKTKIDKTQKLNELVRTLKEVEKITVRDPYLEKLKMQLDEEIKQCELWKRRYLALKRLDISKREEEKDDEEELPNKETLMLGCSGYLAVIKRKEKYTFKNPDYSFYFKLPILINQFFNGTKLRIPLDELFKLRNSLEQVHNCIKGYIDLAIRQEPTPAKLLTLEQDCGKLNIFFLEGWMVRKRSRYIQSWKVMAGRVIESVPILKLEELELYVDNGTGLDKNGLNSQKKEEKKTDNKQIPQPTPSSQKLKEVTPVLPTSLPLLPLQQSQQSKPTQSTQMPAKRIRRQNQYYNNSQIITFPNNQDLCFMNPKKKRKACSAADLPGDDVVSIKKKQSEQVQQRTVSQKTPLKKENEIEKIEYSGQTYCICRKGLMNEASVMICCEDCQEWFHIECVGIKKSQVRHVLGFYCMICCEKLNLQPDYLSNFPWTSKRKLNQPQFMTLLQEGRQIGVKLAQLPKLQVLEERIRRWKISAEKIIEQSSEDRARVKKRAYELYLESIWLPVIFLESEWVKKLATEEAAHKV